MHPRNLPGVRCNTHAVLAILLALLTGATAQETVIHSFKGSPTDGANPLAGLVFDASGNFYGTTQAGGAGTSCNGGCGTVFELVNGTTYKVLYSFPGNTNGSAPAAGLVLDSHGNLYGTTKSGGNGFGTVFELTLVGTTYKETVLYKFTGGTGGASPVAALTFDSANNLWGTTEAGGTSACSGGCGTVFELLQPGYTELGAVYNFKGAPAGDGAAPMAGVIFDGSGNLYGTTEAGGTGACGSTGCGTVFELVGANPADEKVLFSFAGSDGTSPRAGLIFDGSGNLYSTTEAGGASTNCVGGCGTVFELAFPDYSGPGPIYSFKGATDGDGAFPVAALVLDTSGDLYGTATQGGALGGACGSTGCGTIFEVSPVSGGWTESTLFDFQGANGQEPASAPTSPQPMHGPKGCTTGCTMTTVGGGAYGMGTVAKFTN